VLALIAVLAAAAVVLGLVFVTNSVGASAAPCSPPSASEMRGQEEFLRAYIPDASGLEWEVADCDDEGLASLYFETALEPSTASAALLGDPSCSPYRGPGAAAGDVACSSGSGSVVVSFERPPGSTTRGELVL
jgi:hypothetical protein